MGWYWFRDRLSAGAALLLYREAAYWSAKFGLAGTLVLARQTVC